MDYKDLTVRQYYDILEVLENAEEAIDIQVGLIEAVYGVDAMNYPYKTSKRRVTHYPSWINHIRLRK